MMAKTRDGRVFGVGCCALPLQCRWLGVSEGKGLLMLVMWGSVAKN